MSCPTLGIKIFMILINIKELIFLKEDVLSSFVRIQYDESRENRELSRNCKAVFILQVRTCTE